MDASARMATPSCKDVFTETEVLVGGCVPPSSLSLRQLAAFSGTTYSQARAVADEGIIERGELTWFDAIALRVFLPVQSMVLVGEAAARNVPKDVAPRTLAAIEAVQDALENGRLTRDSVLTVGRNTAAVHPSLAYASKQSEVGLYGDGAGALLVLPVGRWWWEVQWREV